MTSKSNILTLELKEKIKLALKKIVVQEHSNSNKQMIKDMHGRLSCACPYCGDSTRDDTLKRGNLYWDTLQYHCFNCDYHTDVYGLLKDHKIRMSDNMDTIGIIEYIKNNKTSADQAEKFTPFIYEKIMEISVSKEDFSKATGAKPIEIGDWIWFKLKDRLLHKKLENFLYCEKDGRLWILNTTREGKIIGAQARRMIGKGSRYLTYDISKIYEGVLNQTLEIDTEDLNQLNNISTLFGALHVNFQSPVTVFEGPMDSLFMKNSIALCTVGRDTTKLDNIDTVRYMLDNDTAGLKKTIEKLKSGRKVFMWTKFLSDKKLDKYNIKDLNDLIKICYLNGIKISLSNLEEYFTNNRLDLRYV
tara:strand:- start:303 stop:1382 length:1080 start_codon:yes stop_codon:yes gene_type:complete